MYLGGNRRWVPLYVDYYVVESTQQLRFKKQILCSDWLPEWATYEPIGLVPLGKVLSVSLAM